MLDKIVGFVNNLGKLVQTVHGGGSSPEQSGNSSLHDAKRIDPVPACIFLKPVKPEVGDTREAGRCIP